MKPVIIEAVLNGYVVKVGCQRVVFETQARLLNALKDYLNDPQQVEKDYLDNAFYPDMYSAPTQLPSSPLRTGGLTGGLK